MPSAPVVTTVGKLPLLLNSSIPAASMFSVFDADNDFITRYRIQDSDSALWTGYFTLNGVPVTNGSMNDILHTQLPGLSYVSGSQIGSETISIQAFDGSMWSAIATLQVFFVNPNVTAPIVQVQNVDVLANEIINIGAFISAFDPDGWPIEKYYLRDNRDTASSGFLMLGGLPLAQNVFHTIPADQIGSLNYSARQNYENEKLIIYAYDGAQWSARTELNIKTLPNLARPAVYYNTKQVGVELETTIADVLTWFDSDGNTIKAVEFWDTNPHANSGNLMYNGQALAPKEWHSFNWSDVNNLTFVGGKIGIEERLRFRVYDGRYWSNVGELLMKTMVRPVFSHQPFLHDEDLKSIQVSSWYSKLDTGPAFTMYQVIDMDGDANSARFRLGGSFLQTGVIHNLTPAQFNALTLQTGRYHDRELDTLLVRASNGFFWTPWAKTEFRTEPEYNMALRMINGSPDNNFNDWRDWGVWPPRITFSFMQDFPNYDVGEAVDDPPVWQPFAAQRNGIRAAMTLAEDYINVDFVEVSDAITDGEGRRGGILRIGNYFLDNSQSSMLRAFTFAPDDTIQNPQGGDMWFNLFWPEVSAGWNVGQISHSIFLTQFGGSIGLQDAGTVPALPALTRNKQYTVMAADGRPTGGLPAHFQLYDVWALQRLYGANNSTRTGNDNYTVANFLGNNPNGARVIWDAGGNDTITATGSQASMIDLRQGSFSHLNGVLNNVAIAFNANIENAVGSSGNDTLIGNHLNNVLMGGGGNDILWGNAGDDFLSGGVGNDTYIWKMGDQNLTIDEQAGTGIDVLEIDDSFPTLNSFSQDLAFRRDGLDLLIDIRLERGNTSDGIIRVVNQKWGAWRVETMVFNGVNIDLADVYEKSSADWKNFSVSNVVGTWGRLVNPA